MQEKGRQQEGQGPFWLPAPFPEVRLNRLPAFCLRDEVSPRRPEPGLGQVAVGVLPVAQGTEADAQMPLDLPHGSQPALILGLDQRVQNGGGVHGAEAKALGNGL